MASGGYRVGSGRPVGSFTVSRQGDLVVEAKRHRTKEQAPLEYMLAVMNDPEIDAARRDRMAIAAAPYVHGRMSDNRIGKKDAIEAAVVTVAEGASWGELVH